MNSKQNKYLGTWGQFSHEEDIHPDDKEKIILFPYEMTIGLIFHCIAANDDYLTLKYGDILIRVKPESYYPIPQKLVLEIGDWVNVKDELSKKGIIYEIQWHRNEEKPMFFLRVNGTRKSTRRYWEEELEKIDCKIL
jgi:hypothetical protein